jgi:hypothetical protein
MESVDTQIFLAWCEYVLFCAQNPFLEPRAHEEFISFRNHMLKQLELIQTWLNDR